MPKLGPVIPKKKKKGIIWKIKSKITICQRHKDFEMQPACDLEFNNKRFPQNMKPDTEPVAQIGDQEQKRHSLDLLEKLNIQTFLYQYALQIAKGF